MAPTATSIAAIHGPYEDLAIAVVELITEIVKSQPKDVSAELWRMYLEDVKGWREFLTGLGIVRGKS